MSARRIQQAMKQLSLKSNPVTTRPKFGAPPLDRARKHSRGTKVMFFFPAVFSADEGLVLTASLDRTAKLWSTATGECTQTFSGHKNDFFLSAVFSAHSPQGMHCQNLKHRQAIECFGSYPSGPQATERLGTFAQCHRDKAECDRR